MSQVEPLHFKVLGLNLGLIMEQKESGLQMLESELLSASWKYSTNHEELLVYLRSLVWSKSFAGNLINALENSSIVISAFSMLIN